MSRLTEKLAQKIKEDLGVDADPETFFSIRPKPSFKSAGAWSWEMHIRHSHPSGITRKIGSSWTASECVRSDVKLVKAEYHPACSFFDTDIIPEKK